MRFSDQMLISVQDSTPATWSDIFDNIMECTRLSVVFEANIKLDVGVGG